tara:strand:+ start:78 stop:530 length:453 start_codon:yes stop_codon:yes gene_type:complete
MDLKKTFVGIFTLAVTLFMSTLILMAQRGAKWTVPAAIGLGLLGAAGMQGNPTASADVLGNIPEFLKGYRYGRGEGLGWAAVFVFIGSVITEWNNPEPEPTVLPMEPSHFQIAGLLTAIYTLGFLWTAKPAVETLYRPSINPPRLSSAIY